MKTFHFISGLPRSGSTLLASILMQNPKFYSSIESPIGAILTGAHGQMGPASETHIMLTEDDRLRMLRAIMQAYYAPKTQPCIIDNNRRWCASIELCAAMFPECKMIVCVRSVAAILDSFEQLLRAHPSMVSVLTDNMTNLNVYQRCNMMLRPGSVVGWAYNALRTAFYSAEKHRLIVVRYDNLAQFPEETMLHIYDQLKVPPFKHDFEAIKQIPGVEEFDKSLGLPGLHSLFPKVAYVGRPSVLPPDLIAGLPPSFWDVQNSVTKSE